MGEIDPRIRDKQVKSTTLSQFMFEGKTW